MSRLPASFASAGSATRCPSSASVPPQALQKRAGSGTDAPQEAHTVFGGPLGCATCAPHSRQKRSPRRYSPLQEGQTSGAAEGWGTTLPPAPASTGSSRKSSRMLPMATRSPSRRPRSLTRSPLTTEPLAELQSRRKNWLPRCSITAWRRDTIASGSTRSFEGSRPMVRIVVRARGISRRFEEVGLTISFATGSYPPRKVCLKTIWTFTRVPRFVAGWNFQRRIADTTTSSSAFPPDSTTETS